MAKVTYDNRSLLVDGKRMLMLSGAIHYSRSTPAMWPELMARSKAAGLNTVETYVFWNLHEKKRGVYDFSGRLDLRQYCLEAQKQGLSVVLRIGPYICAETNYGGFPPWLRDMPGMVMRTWNEPFMAEMERWSRLLCDYMRPMFAPQGGPIVLAQFENEYNNVARYYGENGQKYLAWAAKLGESLNLNVPVIMCQGGTKGAIDTINGFYVHELLESHFAAHPDQPALSTEFYPGWMDTWGYPHHTRPAEDMAYTLARFFAGGAAGINYYMWHGGTIFGRESMYLQTTSYDFDAPLDEYGLETTKLNHLARLHRILVDYTDVLLGQDRARGVELAVRSGSGKSDGTALRLASDAGGGGMPGEQGVSLAGMPMQAAWIYGRGNRRLVFLSNDDKKNAVSVEFEGKVYQLAARSVIILGGGKILLDTSRIVPSSVIRRSMKPLAGALSEFQSLPEPLPGDWPSELQSEITSKRPIEQLQFTKDETDYCWYTARFKVLPKGDCKGTLKLKGAGDLVYVYIDGKLRATTPTPLQENRNLFPESKSLDIDPVWAVMRPFTFEQSFDMEISPGEHEISILCCAMGMVKGDWMLGMHNMVNERKGMWAPVTWNRREITGWSIQPGLLGQRVGLAGDAGAALKWKPCRKVKGPTWLRATFSKPKGSSPLAVDLSGMTKGTIYLNGQCVGRYWLIGGRGVDVFEKYRVPIVNHLSDEPTQRYYHLPPDWLAAHNTLTLLEEQGGDPSKVKLVARK